MPTGKNKKVGKLSNNYYVYMYLTPDSIPFYIGKGKNRRHKICKHLGKSSYNPLLENKIRKVGIDNVIIHFPHKDLTEEQAFYLEEYYIAGYGRRDLGLGPLCNLTNGGDGISGFTHSNETKQKISEGNKGKIISNESKQKMSEAKKGEKNSNYGKHFSNETKQKIRDGNKGKLSPMKGKTLSVVTKQKMSKAAIGRKLSDETKQKISEGNKGKLSLFKGILRSDAVKQKISASMKGRIPWNKGIQQRKARKDGS